MFLRYTFFIIIIIIVSMCTTGGYSFFINLYQLYMKCITIMYNRHVEYYLVLCLLILPAYIEHDVLLCFTNYVLLFITIL